MTADQLVKGFQFTTDAAPTGNIGDGTITVNPNGTNIHNYVKVQVLNGLMPPRLRMAITADFKAGFVEIEITENYELSDNLSVETAGGNITVTNGVVILSKMLLKAKRLRLVKVDDIKNGQNGTTLKN